MRNKNINLKFVVFLLLISCVSVLNAQVGNQIKSMINQFQGIQPQEIENDEVVSKSAPFPVDTKLNEALYRNTLNNSDSLFVISEFQANYTEVDGKEYQVNNVTLTFTYLALPCFHCISGWFELETLKDKEGNDLLMKEKIRKEYEELEIIEEEFNYPFPGEFSEIFWLDRALNWNEKISMKAKVMLEFPAEYEMLVLTAEDSLKEYTIDGVKYRILEVKNNLVTYLVKGDRKKIENMKVIPLNKENMPFATISSIAIDADAYDMKTRSVKDYSDKELQEYIDSFKPNNQDVEQVKKTSVRGSIDKIVIMHIKQREIIEEVLEAELQAAYDF